MLPCYRLKTLKVTWCAKTFAMKRTFNFSCTCVLVAATLLGCGKPPIPPTNEVTGRVTLDGKPLPQVAVMFTPDSKVDGRTVESTAITDSNGEYKLIYSMPTSNSNKPLKGTGAVAGTHTVTVSDYKMVAESLPPPGRIPLKYTEKGSTPLSFEVQEGPQSIDIKLE